MFIQHTRRALGDGPGWGPGDQPGPSVGSAVLHSDGGRLLGGEQLEEALPSRWGYRRGGSASLCFSVCVRTRASAHTEFLSRIPQFLILWTVAHQAPLSREFSMQEYWSGLPFLSPGDLPDPGIKPSSRPGRTQINRSNHPLNTGWSCI